MIVALCGDESYEQLDVLKSVDNITMLLHNVPYGEEKTGRVHAARRYVHTVGKLKSSVQYSLQHVPNNEILIW